MRNIIIAIIATVVSVASADLAVDFKNSQTAPTILLNEGYSALGPGAGLTAGAYVQLVWSANNTGYQSGDIDVADAQAGVGALSDGSYVLAVATAGIGGTFAEGATTYTSANVGGADINSGYFYARVFQTGAANVGDYFVEMGLEGPALNAYSNLDAASTYSANLNDLGQGTSITAQGTTVIPEPATIGLLGIAAAGLYASRRKTEV